MENATVLTTTYAAPAVKTSLNRVMTLAVLLVADTTALAVAGVSAVTLRYVFHGQFALGDWLSFAPALLIFIVVFAFSDLYPGVGTAPTDEFRTVMRSSTIGLLILLVGPFFVRQGMSLSRIVVGLTWLFIIILVPVMRWIFRAYCSRYPWWGIPTVIIGDSEAGQMMVDLLQGHSRLGLRPVAFLTEGPNFSLESDQSREVFRGNFSHAHRFAAQNPGSYALIAMPTAGADRLRSVVTEYVPKYRNVLVVPDVFGIASLSVSAKDISGVLTLKLDQRLAMFFPRLCKRTIDLAVSLSVALFLLPAFLGLCLAVKMSSRGPIFYGQRRIGRNHIPFKVWKFRSMCEDADEVLRVHLEADPELRSEWESDHKLKRDPRVTKIGQFLRKCSLDELPQLWNVICGDMSLVGPRPIVEKEIEKYGEYYNQYKSVTPGVTGLWQVSGRNNTTYEFRTRIDNYYVRNWSLALDAYILLRTVKTLLFVEGAY